MLISPPLRDMIWSALNKGHQPKASRDSVDMSCFGLSVHCDYLYNQYNLHKLRILVLSEKLNEIFVVWIPPENIPYKTKKELLILILKQNGESANLRRKVQKLIIYIDSVIER